jgi:hypothetical protein
MRQLVVGAVVCLGIAAGVELSGVGRPAAVAAAEALAHGEVRRGPLPVT